MRARMFRSSRTHPQVKQSVEEHGAARENLLPILQDTQSAEHHLEPEVLGATTDALHLSDAQTYGVASFYSMLSTQPRAAKIVRVCDGPVCQLQGCQQIRDTLEQATADENVCVERTSCLGLCDRAPAALVDTDPYGPLSLAAAAEEIRQPSPPSSTYSQPLANEVRIALARVGEIDPEDITTVLAQGAYEVLKSALSRSPAEILQAVADSGLQGRGGAGFPTGRKWKMVADAAGHSKYIVCNADESEPAAFKDRVLLEGDPHLMLEGMALAGYAVGATNGIIYIRGEYEPAAARLEWAIEQAQQYGCLGKNIGGTEFSFHLHVHRGAGAYICGEETALLESLEGKRGEPRIRPPYPTTVGFLGQPTVVNNVETFAKVPPIVSQGASWYRGLGTAASPGTKLFALSGHVNRPGCVEVPFGVTLRELIDKFAGGMRNGSRFKLAMTGGAAGTIVGEASLDVPLDYNSDEQGVSLGAGAMLIMDESVSVLELLTWLLHFFEVESCGKCTPCREGTREARLLLERLQSGSGSAEHVRELRRLARMLNATSLCGLGKSVAWPLESALKDLSDEFPS